MFKSMCTNHSRLAIVRHHDLTRNSESTNTSGRTGLYSSNVTAFSLLLIRHSRVRRTEMPSKVLTFSRIRYSHLPHQFGKIGDTIRDSYLNGNHDAETVQYLTL